MYRCLYIPGGAGFLPSTISQDSHLPQVWLGSPYMDFPHPSADALQIWFFCQPKRLASGWWVDRVCEPLVFYQPNIHQHPAFFLLGKSVIFEHARIFWDANYLKVSHSEIRAVKQYIYISYMYLLGVTSRDLHIIIHPPTPPQELHHSA